jgi:hypothetical protein
MKRETFYQRCAEILNCDHDFVPIIDRYDDEGNKYLSNHSRWVGREPGNGRFENFGVIRHFGSVIHLSFKTTTKQFTNEEDVFEFLKDYMNGS